ncbi:hypothetical protein IUJ34_26980 (plasmid) [Klebsiella pneumoniae subsp. pneumoniae]|uniref:Uncharacterized protein n=1 Tax=Klebsiella pneumoniae subsp. pneumoniae TaxID=72407 RepID=A0A7S9E1U6_KLEPN|nr:hypothetical protein IUJ34_26980 [Klebsiella pneumoniae subsp. pneumoniae]
MHRRCLRCKIRSPSRGYDFQPGNSITNLNNTLTADRNAGDNLIPNYDFLQGATAWDTQYPAGVTFGNFGDGKAGVKLNRTTTTSRASSPTTTSRCRLMVSANIVLWLKPRACPGR